MYIPACPISRPHNGCSRSRRLQHGYEQGGSPVSAFARRHLGVSVRARDSTGIVLPMLLVGDLCAVSTSGSMRAGSICGGCCHRARRRRDRRGDDVEDQRRAYKPPSAGSFSSWPRCRSRGWCGRSGWQCAAHRAIHLGMGLLVSATTMLANGGSIMSLYALAVGLPKYELVGTNAWFFLTVNTFKVPFSARLADSRRLAAAQSGARLTSLPGSS